MDIKEIGQMDLEAERRHWWIRTRFGYIDEACELISNSPIKVLEFGSGTGQNLWYLTQTQKSCQLTGIEPSLPDNFHVPWANLKKSPDGNERADLMLAMDVLEHIDDDVGALKSWLPHLKSDGVVLITVPAFKWLWSNHDDLLEHKRRYTKEEVLNLAKAAGLTPVRLHYAFSFVLPLVWLVRKILGDSKKPSTDLRPPPLGVNALLTLFGKAERLLGEHGFWGSSVVGIFRKAHD
jgi:SAM-dependent methyltransferase